MMMRHIAKGIVVALCVAAGAASAAAQTADEIVEKSLASSGGRAALDKITSRSTVGSMQVSTAGGDFPATIEIVNQAPNKARTVITLDLTAAGAGSVVIEQRFDGEHGYSIDPLRGNGDMPESQAASQRNNIFPSPFLGYKDRGTKIALAGKEKVGDRDAYVLTITPASGAGSRVFVDAETYLVVKGITTLEVPEVGSVEQAIEFSDFRDVDGIKVPFTIKGSSSVQTFTITVSKVEHNVKIDPALFVKPAAR